MPRDIPVGNGSLLVAFDDLYQIRDFYFPYVGKENHSEGHPFRFGVWIDGEFSWIGEGGWTRSCVTNLKHSSPMCVSQTPH
jgi:GH15 family glucan-1,4-alpha-glucosidase